MTTVHVFASVFVLLLDGGYCPTSMWQSIGTYIKCNQTQGVKVSRPPTLWTGAFRQDLHVIHKTSDPAYNVTRSKQQSAPLVRNDFLNRIFCTLSCFNLAYAT